MDSDDSFLAATPPVQVNASQCGSVTIEVRFITETREHDTLKKWAEVIDKLIEISAKSGQITGIMLLVASTLCHE